MDKKISKDMVMFAPNFEGSRTIQSLASINSTFRYIPILMPGETQGIVLPDIINLFLITYINNSIEGNWPEALIDMENFNFIIKLDYQDYKNTKGSKMFAVYTSMFQVGVNDDKILKDVRIRLECLSS